MLKGLYFAVVAAEVERIVGEHISVMSPPEIPEVCFIGITKQPDVKPFIALSADGYDPMLDQYAKAGLPDVVLAVEEYPPIKTLVEYIVTLFNASPVREEATMSPLIGSYDSQRNAMYASNIGESHA